MSPLALSTTRPSDVTNRSLYCRQPSFKRPVGPDAADAVVAQNAASSAMMRTVTRILPSFQAVVTRRSFRRSQRLHRQSETARAGAGTGPKTTCGRLLHGAKAAFRTSLE